MEMFKRSEDEIGNKEKKKILNKKSIIITIALVVIIAILIIIFKFLLLPNIKYNNAQNKYNNKEYKSAIDIYSKLEDYKNSKEMLNNCYYEYGKILINEEKYDEAVSNLEKTSINDTDKYLEYAKALKNMNDGNYDEAIKSLENMNDFEKSKDYIKKSYYLKANSLFESGNYSSAKNYFEKAEDYEDAANKFSVCDFMLAEKKYSEGNLQEAKALYEKLPADLEYNEIKVSDRLATLNDYSKFVNLSGNWKGTNGYYEVRHIYRRDGSWESWNNTYTSNTTIKCAINEDGTVKITGDVTFYSFTNYSSVNSAVKDKSVSVPISITLNSSDVIPETLVKDYPALVASSGEIGKANIKYTNNKISLDFLLNDINYSQYFSNKYTSSITLEKIN